MATLILENISDQLVNAYQVAPKETRQQLGKVMEDVLLLWVTTHAEMPAKKQPRRKKIKAGSAKGLIKMAADFDLVTFFKKSPLYGAELDLERVKDQGREVIL